MIKIIIVLIISFLCLGNDSISRIQCETKNTRKLSRLYEFMLSSYPEYQLTMNALDSYRCRVKRLKDNCEEMQKQLTNLENNRLDGTIAIINRKKANIGVAVANLSVSINRELSRIQEEIESIEPTALDSPLATTLFQFFGSHYEDQNFSKENLTAPIELIRKDIERQSPGRCIRVINDLVGDYL